jgi:DinB superfamily
VGDRPSAHPREVCAECGFDAADWTHAEAVPALRDVAARWQATFSEAVDDARLHQRPDVSVWSAVEYAVHTARVAEAWGAAVAAVVGGGLADWDGAEYPDADRFDYNATSAPDALIDVTGALTGLADWAERATDHEWRMQVTFTSPTFTAMLHGNGLGDVAAGVLHVLHDALHHHGDIVRGLNTLN